MRRSVSKATCRIVELIKTDHWVAAHFHLTLNMEQFGTNSEVLLLLSRHVTDTNRTAEFISLTLRDPGLLDMADSPLKVSVSPGYLPACLQCSRESIQIIPRS